MSGFLTRLVQRTLGQLPVAEPRLPSSFAPTLRTNEGSLLEEVSEVASSSPSISRRPKTMDVDAQAQFSESNQATNNISKVQPEPISLVRQEVKDLQQPIDSRSLKPREGVEFGEQAHDGDILTRASKRNSSEVSREKQILERTIIQKSEVVPRLVKDNVYHPLTASKTIISEKTGSERVASSSPYARDTASNSKSLTSVPTTVQVTIGRIEVKAVMLPAPQPKKISAPVATLSLDDYLKTQGGKR
jgi:hypothetical protein